MEKPQVGDWIASTESARIYCVDEAFPDAEPPFYNVLVDGHRLSILDGEFRVGEGGEVPKYALLPCPPYDAYFTDSAGETMKVRVIADSDDLPAAGAVVTFDLNRKAAIGEVLEILPPAPDFAGEVRLGPIAEPEP